MATTAYNHAPILTPLLKDIAGLRVRLQAADRRFLILIPPENTALSDHHTHLGHLPVAGLT